MKDERLVNKTILIDAPASKVWHFLSDSSLIKTWLADNEIEVISEWKAGSPIIFKGNLHGYDYFAKGTILEFVPEKSLKYNCWNKVEELPDEPENYSVFEFRLEEMDGKTSLSFQHSNLNAKAQYEHSSLYGTSHWAS
jgi:uncharacterized protein YndB with AHSA1/START domain